MSLISTSSLEAVESKYSEEVLEGSCTGVGACHADVSDVTLVSHLDSGPTTCCSGLI